MTQQPSIERLINNLYTQLEALSTIQQTVKLRFPLPSLRGWAISPDFGVLLLKEVLRGRPRRAIELGSGASTVLIAYFFERLGEGKLFSVDHNADYLETTRRMLVDHGLERYVEFIHAPLVRQEVDGMVYSWYDTTRFAAEHDIDLLLVDGPPGRTQENARYPAVPLLRSALAPGAIVLLDDAARPDEKQIVERWLGDLAGARHEYVALEKGASILRLAGG